MESSSKPVKRDIRSGRYMNFKISEFCRLLGVSTDTLRYYERCKLLTTQKNPDNSYRTFSQQDALAIWNLHMLRSMDMSCKDIQKLCQQGSYQAQTVYLHRHEEELKKQIDKLTSKLKRVRQLTHLHELVDDTHTVRLVENLPAHWALYVLGTGCDHQAIDREQIAHWMECLPFTYVAVEISMDSLLRRKGSLSVRMGLGILEENIAGAGLSLCEQAEESPMCRRACTVVSTRDVFSITHQDFALLYDYVDRNGLRITGPATGRILCSNCDAKTPEYRVAFGVPVD